VRAALALLATAAVVLGPAAAGAAAPGKPYSGKSSIQTSVGFRVSAGQVKGFAIGYVAACDDGETLRGTYRFKPTRVKAGRFAVRGSSTGVLADGRATASTLRLSGRLAAGKAKGTFSITTQMAALDGEGVATCRSGRVSWRAARPVS
jgi:hypothetical protein